MPRDTSDTSTKQEMLLSGYLWKPWPIYFDDEHDDLPVENGDFQFATSNYQRVNPQNVHLLGGAGPTLQMGETS